MWKGSISLGMLTIPISVGKSWGDETDPSLKDVCTCHGLPIERHERCKVTGDRPEGKTKGVAVIDATEADGVRWHAMDKSEWDNIKQQTKSFSLDILDIQPLDTIPMHFSIGTYYCRAENGSERAFAIFAEVLERHKMAAVTKWCRDTKQKLAVLHVWDGILLMTVLPFRSAWRAPGEAERAHLKEDVRSQVNMREVAVAEQILNAMSSPLGFAWESYRDDGVALRAQVVDRMLTGLQPAHRPVDRTVPDLMAALEATLDRMTPRRRRRQRRRRTNTR